MGRTCVVPGCSKKSLQGNTVSFHRFPLRHPEKLQLWLNAIGLVNQDLAKHHRICSEHFKPTDFYSIHSNKKKIMKEEAIPTLNLHCSPKKMKSQAKYKSTRSKHNSSSSSKPTPSTSSTQSETKYSNFTYVDTTPESEESTVCYPNNTTETSTGEDKTLLEMQKEKVRRQMHQDMLLFEQQMKFLRSEIEGKTHERERKMAENDLRMQILHTQLEKAQLELEDTKIRIYRCRNSVTQIKNEVIEEEEQAMPELTIIPNDIQLVPMTNGIHSNDNQNSDSNE